jgi:subfamily B ATP-binding cassette protein MsbA
MNWRLTLVMVAILPLIAVMVSTASKKFRKQSKKIQVAMGDVTHVASETIQGYAWFAALAARPTSVSVFKASQSNTDKQLRMTRTGAYTPMLQLVIYTAMAALMFLVLYLRGDASAGDMVALSRWPACCPSRSVSCLKSARPSRRGVAGAESIFEQLDGSLKSTPAPSSWTASGRLEVRNLSSPTLRHERQVLDDISFTAEPGRWSPWSGVPAVASRRWPT